MCTVLHCTLYFKILKKGERFLSKNQSTETTTRVWTSDEATSTPGHKEITDIKQSDDNVLL